MNQPLITQAVEPALRVSYLFSQFPVASQAFAVSDIAALRARGHEVVVHTVKPGRRDETRQLQVCEVPAGLPIRRPSFMGAMRWPVLLWQMRTQLAYLLGQIFRRGASSPGKALTALLSIPRVLEIVDEILKLDADVVHVFWSQHAGMALPVLEQIGSCTVRSAFAGAYDLVANDFLLDMTIEWAEVIFSHAEVNRPLLEEKAPPDVPVRIVRRGIPLTALDADSARDPNLWIAASALTLPKNVEAVIRAFSEARGLRPELRLEVYGDGPDRSRLEQCCRDLGCAGAVSFRGHVKRGQLFREMQRATVFLLLSKKPSERLPNVIKEALWAGCSIISSRSEGIEELLPDSSIGLVIDPDDPSAVTKAVGTVLDETTEDAEQRRQRARRLIGSRFSSEASMRQYEQAWRAARTEGRTTAASPADLSVSDDG